MKLRVHDLQGIPLMSSISRFRSNFAEIDVEYSSMKLRIHDLPGKPLMSPYLEIPRKVLMVDLSLVKIIHNKSRRVVPIPQ